MTKTASRAPDLLHGPVFSNMTRFFLPIMLGSLLQQLYSMVDAVVLGRLVGKTALAAVGGSDLAIINLVVGFFVGLASGACVVVSQHYGAGEDGAVRRAVHTAILFSVVIGAVMTALGIGLAFGLVQGFLVAKLEIQPFIVTLAGMFFAKGMTTIVNATQFNVENEAFKALKETRIYVPGMGSVNKLGAYVPAYVEIGVVVALVVVAVLFVVLRWTKFGRSVYAVGGNSYSANMLAINVKRTKFLAHLICGILAGIGGFVYFLHVGSGSPSHASGAEMNAIASSIIGEVRYFVTKSTGTEVRAVNVFVDSMSVD